MARYAAMYIRESTADEATDKEGQLIDCRTIAARDGVDPTTLVLFDDWSRSGSEGARRPEQDRLMREIRADRVSVVYARSLDRLMRSTVLMAQFYRLCDEHKTRVVTLREGEMRDDNPSQWIARQSIMTAAEYESRVGKVRAAAGVATKRRNGIHIGRLPYGEVEGENVQTIIDAFTEAGSFLGACKLLNDRQVPARVGEWNVRTVARILRRVNAVEPGTQRGTAAGRQPRLFSGLLRCATCKTILTSMPSKWSVRYYCKTAHTHKNHPRPYLTSEAKITPWAMTESRRETRITQTAEKTSSAQASLDFTAKREAIINLAADLTITPDEARTRLRALEEAQQAVRTTERAVNVLIKGVDWSLSVPEVNQALRSIWRYVELDTQMLPVRAQWIVEPSR